jgi:hypothetical protein
VSGNIRNSAQPEGQLFNPDIPDMNKTNYFSSERVATRKAMKDKYYQSTKMPTQPRNGNYFSLDRSKDDINPRLQSFLLEGSIDPNTIRKKIDSEYISDNLYNYGSEGIKYSSPDSAYVSSSNVPLIQQARKSFYNYKNRFNMSSGPAAGQTPDLNTEQPIGPMG